MKPAILKRRDLAHDAKLTLSPPRAVEFSLAHNVSSREEVDAVMEEVQKAGTVITRTCTRYLMGGYSRYF
ncbi:hypothetical protein [Paenibacillus ihuae]|uniref:hypothetical protein n=1 Tax=Paenibacillus ihuae TaxID=1232431 RepID=UPI0009E7A13E|nr:hypothetical protein [Paenibacillus ihuae]